MLDVILYRRDQSGLLFLKERRFRSLRGLAFYFATSPGARWEWAEVDQLGGEGISQTVRYSPDQLRSMVERPGEGPGAN